MKHFYLLTLCALAGFINSTNAQITFQKVLGGTSNNNLFFTRQLSDGGYITSGSKFGQWSVSQDAFLVRLDQYGDTLWTKFYGNSSYESFGDVIVTADGGYALTGRTSQNSPYFEHDVWLIKTDANGNITWTRKYGSTAGMLDAGYSLLQTPDGGYIIIGYTVTNTTGENLFLVKTDATGTMQWSKTFGGIYDDRSTNLIFSADGGYLVSGSYQTASLNTDAYLLKFDASGNMLWNVNFGGNDFDVARTFVELNDGSIMAYGASQSYGGVINDYILVKISPTGTVLWGKTFGVDVNVSTAIAKTTDGNIIMAGNTTGFSGNSDYLLIKADTAGNILWSKTYGGGAADQVGSLIVTNDHGYLITGYSNSFGTGMQDGYYVKTDSMGVSGCNENDVTLTATLVSMPYSSHYTEYTPLTQSTDPVILTHQTDLVTSIQCFNVNCVVDAGFTADNDTVCAGIATSFSNTSQHAVSYQWKVNGQVFATTANASYTFNNAGSYIITLVSVDGICIDSTHTTITVMPTLTPLVT